jgi:hypothetical protein
MDGARLVEGVADEAGLEPVERGGGLVAVGQGGHGGGR